MQGQAQYVTELGPADVLFGRGSGPNDHEGNIQFREMVAERKAEYMATNHRQTKVKIARSIVDAVISKNGRFLKKVSASEAQSKGGFPPGMDAYKVVDDDTVMEKAKQALRQNRDKVPQTPSASLTQSTASYATTASSELMPPPTGTKRRSATVVPSTAADSGSSEFLTGSLSSDNAEAAAVASSVATAAATVTATENYAERQRQAYNAMITGNYNALPQNNDGDNSGAAPMPQMKSPTQRRSSSNELEPQPLPALYNSASYAQAKQIYQLRQMQQQRQQQQQQLQQRMQPPLHTIQRPTLTHNTTIGSNAATVNVNNRNQNPAAAAAAAAAANDDDEDDEYDDNPPIMEGGPQFITYTTPLVDGTEKFGQRDSISTMGSRRDSYQLGFGSTRRSSVFGRRDSMSVGSRRDSSMSIASRRESTDSRRNSLLMADIWTRRGGMDDLTESFQGMSTSGIEGAPDFHSSNDTIGTIDTMYTSGNGMGMSGMSVMSISSNTSFFKIGTSGSPTGGDAKSNEDVARVPPIPTSSSAEMYGTEHGHRVLPLGDRFGSGSGLDNPTELQNMQLMPQPALPIAGGKRDSLNLSDIWRISSNTLNSGTSVSTFNISGIEEPRSIQAMQANPDTLADLGRSSMSVMRAANESGGVGGSTRRASSVFDINGIAMDRMQQY